MRTGALDYKPISLISPKQVSAGTVTGSAVAIGYGAEDDAIAVVHIGALLGSPTSSSLTVTILGSATSAGTYTTLASIATPVSSTITTGQIATAVVTVPPSYTYFKATAVSAITGGTTPSITYGVSVLQRQTVGSTSTEGTLA